MNEQRTHQRLERNCLFVIYHELGSIIRNTIDISESGLKMDQADRQLSSGQQVRVTFSPRINEVYVANAEVVRSNEDSVALRFENNLDSDVLAKLVAA